MRDAALFQHSHIGLVTSATRFCFPKSPRSPGATHDRAWSRGTLRAACGVPRSCFCSFVWASKCSGWCNFEDLSSASEEVQPDLCPGFPGSGSATEVVLPLVAPSHTRVHSSKSTFRAKAGAAVYHATGSLAITALQKRPHHTHTHTRPMFSQSQACLGLGHENSGKVRIAAASRHLYVDKNVM